MVTKTNKKEERPNHTLLKQPSLRLSEKKEPRTAFRQSLRNTKSANQIEKKILLMGNPNVGKSVIFSGLCKKQAESANYAGTTVSVTQGTLELEKFSCNMIDVPGAYTFEPNCEAEQIAVSYLKQGADLILCVLDATNLEQSLSFAMKLTAYQIPTVYCLNLSDVARKQGISIDCKKLSKMLCGPVIETIAVKGYGFTEIKHEICHILAKNMLNHEHKKETISPIISEKEIEYQIHLLKEQEILENNSQDAGQRGLQNLLSDAVIHPFWGSIIAILVLSASIFLMIRGGEFLIQTLFAPMSELFISFFQNSVSHLNLSPVWKEFLIGEYGIFVTPFEWILGSIFPYVLLFYAVFSFLEDSGYLPRISVLFDNIMRKLGLQGGSLIPLLLGYGCAVPAILATRSSEQKKERLIAAAIICFCIPCTSQTGALVKLFAGQPVWFLPFLFLLSLLLVIPLSAVLQKVLKGNTPPMVIELPNLLLPSPRTYCKKLKFRFKHFLFDAEGPMLLAVLLIAFLSSSGILDQITSFLSPVMVTWLGLPKEAAVALIAGIIRREMSVAPLLALSLTPLQVFTGAVVSLFYLPCLSVFAVLTKEFGIKTAVLMAVSTVLTAFLMGGIVHFAGIFLTSGVL